MPIQAPASIRARLMRMNLIVVIVSIALSLAGTLYFTLRSEQRALDNNLLNSASILSRVPLLRETLQGVPRPMPWREPPPIPPTKPAPWAPTTPPMPLCGMRRGK